MVPVVVAVLRVMRLLKTQIDEALVFRVLVSSTEGGPMLCVLQCEPCHQSQLRRCCLVFCIRKRNPGVAPNNQPHTLQLLRRSRRRWGVPRSSHSNSADSLTGATIQCGADLEPPNVYDCAVRCSCAALISQRRYTSFPRCYLQNARPIIYRKPSVARSQPRWQGCDLLLSIGS
jgi:hypothetical protein